MDPGLCVTMYFMKPWMIGCLVVPMGTIKPPLFSLWCWCFHQGINQEAEAMPLSFTQWKRQSTTICSVLGKQTFKFHSLYSMVIRNSFPSALWSFFFFNHFFPYALLFSSLQLHLNICHYATVMALDDSNKSGTQKHNLCWFSVKYFEFVAQFSFFFFKFSLGV